MKKLIMLSAACLFVFGAFANPMNSNQQSGAKPTTQNTATAPAKATPAKTDSKPTDKKDKKKDAKKVKKVPANGSK